MKQFPPLPSDTFFPKLSVIKKTIDKLPIIYNGGGSFSAFIKLNLAKLRHKDWTSFEGQFSELHFEKIKNFSGSAISAGISSYKKDATSITKGIYHVNASNNNDLRILGEIDNDLVDVSQFTNNLIEDCITHENLAEEDESDLHDVQAKLKAILNETVVLDDRGLILDLPNVERWILKQFESNIDFMNRRHDNHKQVAKLFSLLMMIIYKRREYRVLKWLNGNLNANDSGEAKKLRDSINRSLKILEVQLAVQTCAQTCGQCKYSCLRNHSNQGDQMIHDCFGDHKCKLQCERCDSICTQSSGHSGVHVCDSRDKNHCCNQVCSLNTRCKCNGRCNFKPGHSEKDDYPHMCNAAHICNKKCDATWTNGNGQEIKCEGRCKVGYDVDKGDIAHIHDCERNECLARCSVNCRTEIQDDNGTKWIIGECKRQCGCKNHFHDQIIHNRMKKMDGCGIKLDIGKYGIHCCGETHKCPAKCEVGAKKIDGNNHDNIIDSLDIRNRDAVCKWKVSTKYDTKLYENSNGNFYYPEWNVPESIVDWCEHLIPEFKQNHSSIVKEHACGVDNNKHRCTKQCAACGYNCIKPAGHVSKHKAIHGNMKNSVFLASDKDKVISIVNAGFNETVEEHNNVVAAELRIIDDMDDIKHDDNSENKFDPNEEQIRGYNVGDLAKAELCNLFCLTHGRGHVHLKLCSYQREMPQCKRKQYTDQNDLTKWKWGQQHSNVTFDDSGYLLKQCDAMTHSFYWESMGFEDPVHSNENMKNEFEKCNFECSHNSHNTHNAPKAYCTLDLWHEPKTSIDSQRPGFHGLLIGGHLFNCTHPIADPPHMLSLYSVILH